MPIIKDSLINLLLSMAAEEVADREEHREDQEYKTSRVFVTCYACADARGNFAPAVGIDEVNAPDEEMVQTVGSIGLDSPTTFSRLKARCVYSYRKQIPHLIPLGQHGSRKYPRQHGCVAHQGDCAKARASVEVVRRQIYKVFGHLRIDGYPAIQAVVLHYNTDDETITFYGEGVNRRKVAKIDIARVSRQLKAIDSQELENYLRSESTRLYPDYHPLLGQKLAEMMLDNYRHAAALRTMSTGFAGDEGRGRPSRASCIIVGSKKRYRKSDFAMTLNDGVQDFVEQLVMVAMIVVKNIKRGLAFKISKPQSALIISLPYDVNHEFPELTKCDLEATRLRADRLYQVILKTFHQRVPEILEYLTEVQIEVFDRLTLKVSTQKRITLIPQYEIVHSSPSLIK